MSPSYLFSVSTDGVLETRTIMYKILVSTTASEKVLPIGKALREIGYNVCLFDASIRSPIDKYIFRPTNKMLWNLRLMDKGRSIGGSSLYCNKIYRTKALLQLVDEYKPDCIIFVIGFKPSYEGLEILRTKVKKICGWWILTSRWINIEEREHTLYDAFFLFRKEFVPIAKDRGFNAFYRPHVVNDYVFKNINITSEEKKLYGSDVIFVGGQTPPRRKVVDILSNLNIDIRIYGPNWRRYYIFQPRVLRAIKGIGLYGDELVKHYVASKIVLNISGWFTEKAYEMNQRIFDVPACGGFLLTDYMDELESFFKIGEEIEAYKSVEELIDKIQFYLKHEDIRERIAIKGYEKAQRLPTWKDWAKEVVRLSGLPVQG